MTHFRLALSLVLCAFAFARTHAAELVVLVPMMAGDKPVLREGPKSESAKEAPAPILKRAPNDAITKSIAVEASRGTTRLMLVLDEQAQRLAGATTPAPIYLLRSKTEGGFARRGFWLSDANNNVVWHADPFVDLAIDQQDVDDGGFEESFAHEAGHVLLRRLLPRLPNGLSRVPHASFAVTDYPTAFDEGFAIHFQGIARFVTQNMHLKAADKGLGYQPFIGLWQSNLDRSLRLRGVRDNLFVYRQFQGDENAGDATTAFDLSHLKNGQQMMSSEGMIATLFYHLMLKESDTSAALIERYKSILTSIKTLNGQKLNSTSPVFLNFLQTHIQRVPADKDRWLSTTIALTYGATAGNNVTRDFAKLAALGQQGRPDFSSALKQSRSALSTLTDQVKRNPQRLGAALGPELWLGFKNADGSESTLNLNTAEKRPLIGTLGLDELDAELLIADRIAKGPFNSLDEFAARRKAPALMRKQLAGAFEMAVRMGGFQRP